LNEDLKHSLPIKEEDYGMRTDSFSPPKDFGYILDHSEKEIFRLQELESNVKQIYAKYERP